MPGMNGARTTHRRAVSRWSRPVRDRYDADPGTGSGRPGLFVAMCWLGLVTGFLELAVVAGQRAFVTRISLESLRMSRHFVWMIPVANLLLFGAWGLVLALVGRRRAAVAGKLSHSTGAGLVAAGLLLSVEVLSSLTCLIVSCGLMYRATAYRGRGASGIARIIRKTFPVLLGVAVILAVAWTTRLALAEHRALELLPPPPAAAPNVLLVVMDDVRAASTSLHGRARPTTPRLEQLARGGVCFDAARSTSSWTLPSHASMFTGLWPHQTSVDWNRGLDGRATTLAEWLAGRGYATAGFVGNTFYCNARYGLDRGFARYEDFLENRTVSLFEILRTSSLGRLVLRGLGYSMNFEPGEHHARKTAAAINRDVLAWLDSRPSGRPFFAFLNYYDAHAPFVPPDESTRRFGKCALPEVEQVNILKRAARAPNSPALTEAERARIHHEANEVRLDGYESCIAYVDEQIGRLLDEMRRRGLLENTLVIVTSDHGEHFQERGFSGHGMSLYRREIHVPLLIVPPSGNRVVRRIADPVSLRDLPATVVNLLGLGGSSPFPGHTLARYWRGGGPLHPAPGDVRSELGHQATLAPNPAIPATLGSTRALTGERAVYIRNSQGNEELYDRLEDPFEERNLIGQVADGDPLALEKERLSQGLDDESPCD